MKALLKQADGPDHQRAQSIRKLFSGFPQKVGRVGGSDIPLEQALVEDASIDLPPYFFKKSGPILRALLMPDAEKTVVQGDNQPRVFGIQSLLKILMSALKNSQINLNVGMSACREISPMYPSYLEIGLQRLQDLLLIGINARLRIFSTASLAPHVNGADPNEVKRMQEIQFNLASRYIEAFYPELVSNVDLSAILQEVELMNEGDLRLSINKIRQLVSEEVISALEACGQNHGGDSGAENALAYAAYHGRADVFQDEGPVENLISIGGPGEVLFNEVRFALANEEKANLGIVVAKPLIARTPPYLQIPNGLRMDEFLQQNSERVVDFMRDPKANKHRLAIGGAQNMIHLGRCLSADHANIPQGLDRLQKFFQENIEILS